MKNIHTVEQYGKLFPQQKVYRNFYGPALTVPYNKKEFLIQVAAAKLAGALLPGFINVGV
ncbi:MAG: hypothetical protein ACLVAA_00045 [Ruthenibacterium sp.]